MLIGCMRVSKSDGSQTIDLQRDALIAAGVDERHLFEDRVSGSRGDRTGLAKALAFIKSGDCLVVWKLDRLGRSLPHLLTTITDLKKRGIDPKDHQRIFDLFRRAGPQDKPGQGIGLAHVRALVRRLGGTLSVQSELNKGSTFTITLPISWTASNRNRDK